MDTTTERRMYVAWRRPDRLIVPVGELSQRTEADGEVFHFAYLKNAELEPQFRCLPGLPDLHHAYESPSLFAVFANRLMPRSRPDYVEFVRQLDLDPDAPPFEVLERSEGSRATDRIEVFPFPRQPSEGDLTTVFFARGIRHVEGASEAVQELSDGDELVLVREPTNPANPMAIVMHSRTGRAVGYVPDYLLDLLHDLEHENGRPPQVLVELVNPPQTPPHMRLLCRVVATWPPGYRPFSGPEFQPLAR